MVGWLVGCLDCWLVGWSVGWSVELVELVELVFWVGRLVGILNMHINK